ETRLKGWFVKYLSERILRDRHFRDGKFFRPELGHFYPILGRGSHAGRVIVPKSCVAAASTAPPIRITPPPPPPWATPGRGFGRWPRRSGGSGPSARRSARGRGTAPRRKGRGPGPGAPR